MDLNWDKYDLVCEQLKQCLLPEFDRDIGDEPLVKEDFSMFRYGLELNLQLLFDVVSRNERLMLESYEGNNTFQINFSLLIHQQSGYDDAPFQSDNASIAKQFRLLIDKYYKRLISQPDIYKECLQYYKERLTNDKWKRNIGALYGYLQMNKLHQSLIQPKFRADDCLFMLSVGLNLTDYFETSYKKFGLILLNILLDFGNATDLKKLNLYELIYKKMMNPLIQVLKDETSTVLMLSCLYKCVKNFDKWHDPSKWNEVDDVLKEILNRIPFEMDNRCAAILYMFIARITTLPMKLPTIFYDQIDFENFDRVKANTETLTEEEQSEMYNKLRSIFSGQHNLLIGRWSRRLLDIFKQRQIIGMAPEIRFQIHILHVCYLCCFYGNPLFVKMKWFEFIKEFVSCMLQLIPNNINRNVFVSEIYDFLETFKLQMENADPRLDLLAPFKYDLNTEDGRKQAEEAKNDPTIAEIEEYIANILKSIHDITIELKSYVATKSDTLDDTDESEESDKQDDPDELEKEIALQENAQEN